MAGILAGALVNLATSAFDLTRWRWWLAGAIVVVAIFLAVLEMRNSGPMLRGSMSAVDTLWSLPRLDGTPIPRPGLVHTLTEMLTSREADTVGITTGIYGAGGFGKTTLAVLACAQPAVRARYPGGLVWATIGEERRGAELAAIANDLSAQLTGDRPQFSDPEQAGQHLGHILDNRPPTLVVIDDVWEAEQLRPFSFGERNATRLVTTRNQAALPAEARTIRVDEMQRSESHQLLTRDLAELPTHTATRLLDLTGDWPLLLALVNGALRAYVRDGVELAAAGEELVRQLAVDGPAVLDLKIDTRRDHAVRVTIAASMRRLTEERRGRYLRMGIFQEDSDISLDALAALWHASPQETRQLCQELAILSLVKAYRPKTGEVQLHDVIRGHLRHELGDSLPRVSAAFLDATRRLHALESEGRNPTQWWRLPAEQDYLWRHLTYHLAEAGQTAELSALVCDLRWVEEKIRRFGLAAYESDVSRVNTPIATSLRRALARKGHLLGPIEPAHSHADVLVSRLGEIPELHDIVAAYRGTLPDNVARITSRWPIPPVDPALMRVLAGHAGPLTSCAIAPDGDWLATTSHDHMVRVWDTTEWGLRRQLIAHTDVVITCAVMPNGSLLATAGTDHTVRIWDTTTWAHRVRIPHPGSVLSCTFAPNSDWLATTCVDRTVRVFDTKTWAMRHQLRGLSAAPTSSEVAPDGSWLAVGDAKGALTVWDTATWRRKGVHRKHRGAITSCAAAPDGWMITTGADGMSVIWDVPAWRQRTTLNGHTRAINHSAVAPDGTWLVTTGEDNITRIWDVATWTLRGQLRGHTEPVSSCAISSDGSWLVTTSMDHTSRIWDTSSQHRRRIGRAQNSPINRCAIPSGAAYILTAGSEDSAGVWDMDRHREEHVLTGHRQEVTDCAVAPDATWAVTTSADGTALIWSTSNWEASYRLAGHSAAVTSCAISPDGTWLATTGDQEVFIWDVATRTEVRRLTAHGCEVTGCVIAPDGTWMLTTGADGLARIWETATWRQLATVTAHDGAITGRAIAPDGDWVATTGADGAVRVWDTADWSLRNVLTPHQGAVRGCAISPERGRWLATIGDDHSLRIWDRQRWEASASMWVNGRPNGVAWLPDGTGICVVGVGGIYVLNFTPPHAS